MAISKTQPMRSAEIELVDAVNDNTTAIANLSTDLNNEIAAREGADTTLDNKIDTEITQRANSDTEIMNIIGTGFSSSNTIASNVGNIQDSIGSGFSSENTIASNIGDIQDSIGTGFSSSNTISTNIGDIQGAIGSGFSSENTIASNIGDIQDSIGSGFSSENTIASNVQNLQGFDNRFRIGVTQAYTIAASGTQSVTVDLDYEQTDDIIVLVCPVGASESFTELTCVLNSAGYAGFSATIENTDTVNSVTVAFGYIAIKVN